LNGLAEIHGEFVSTKLNMVLYSVVTDAILANDQSTISTELDLIYPFYAKFIDSEEVVSKAEMLSMMLELYNEETE
jgi:hypothetical protein